MKNSIPVLILCSLISAGYVNTALADENKARIVVFDMDSKSRDISQDEVISLSDYVRTSFIGTGDFDVISREQLNKVMEEYKFQKAGLTEETNVVRLGRILNVDNAVMGTVGKFGDTYIINIKMLNLETGKYLSAESIKADTKKECLEGIDEKVALIAEKISSKSGENPQNEENTVKNVSDDRNLCPDGNFNSKTIITIGGGYTTYLAGLEGKWQLENDNASDVRAVIENGQAHIKINTHKNDPWSVRLSMMPVKLEKGKTYRMSYKAKADKPKIITVVFIRVGGDWTVYGTKDFNINTGIKDFSFEFKMNMPSNEKTRMDFNLNDSTGECWISKVRVEDVK